jgi:hypothetical protein
MTAIGDCGLCACPWELTLEHVQIASATSPITMVTAFLDTFGYGLQ